MLNQENFGLLKFLGFASCFFLFALIQWLIPYREMGTRIFINWKKNIPLALINGGIMSIFCASCVCVWASFLHERGLGLINMFSVSGWLSIPFALIILDATGYFWHKMNHRVAWLWRLHSVHHSDQIFEASTAVRFHLGELLVSLIIRLTVVAIFGLSVSSILIFELIFQFFNVFEHGNIRLPLKVEAAISTIFITPAIHRKHHSVNAAELNSNFGTIFSFWDKIGSSFCISNSSENVRVGLAGHAKEIPFLDLMTLPFKKKASSQIV